MGARAMSSRYTCGGDAWRRTISVSPHWQPAQQALLCLPNAESSVLSSMVPIAAQFARDMSTFPEGTFKSVKSIEALS